MNTIDKKKDFKQKMDDFRKLHKQRKAEAPKLIKPVTNPRYDDVYHAGVVFLNSL